MLAAFAKFSSSSNQNHAYLSYPRLHCMQITDDVRLRGPTLRYSVPLSAYILSSRINAVPTWFTCVALVGPSWVIRRIFSPIYRLKPSTHTQDGRALRRDKTGQNGTGRIKESSKKNIRRRLHRQPFHLESSHLKLTPTWDAWMVIVRDMSNICPALCFIFSCKFSDWNIFVFFSIKIFEFF